MTTEEQKRKYLRYLSEFHWHPNLQWRNDNESAPQTVATPNPTQTTPPSSSAKRTAASMPVISPAEAGPGRRLDATAVRQSTPDPEQVPRDRYWSPPKKINSEITTMTTWDFLDSIDYHIGCSRRSGGRGWPSSTSWRRRRARRSERASGG